MNVEELTYQPVGMSRILLDSDHILATPAGSDQAGSGVSRRPVAWPAGFRAVRHRVAVGHGEDIFQRLGSAILGWGIQRGAGLSVSASAPVTVGADVVTGFGWGSFRLPAPCRVVWAESGPRLIGFGYGTLPGHPASGEEAFAAQLDDDGAVHCVILAYSVPSPGLYTLGAPVARAVQSLVTKRYLRAAERLAA
ncbi:DUF1990 family protein [Psychromicrobium xiongbiense]|uniref:DUF1990 family protein n=1 Tax=Psychromicrobium xiongbiense TaxID=3051184 RepID=UPI002554F2F5|nr:DUF1990 domain-containing protein [Psychromicrobium sp. YIM S02556]